MNTSYNTPNYNQPRRGKEVPSRGNELLVGIVESRQEELIHALRNVEVGGNASIAQQGVMPSAGQPEQSVSPQQVIHAENRFGTYSQVPVTVQPSRSREAAARPDTSFNAPSVEESRATVDRIFTEITQARENWHAQDQHNTPQELGHAA